MADHTTATSTQSQGPRPTAAFFDLDKTIIATSSSMAFSKSFYEGGLVTRTDAIRTAYAQFVYLVGGADARQTNRLRDALSDLIKGWEVKKVRAIVKDTLPGIYSKELVETLFVNPYCKGEFLVTSLGVERKTAARYLKQLEDSGILESVKVGTERIFIHTELIRLLKE